MRIFDPKLTGSIEILNTIQGNVTIAGGLTVNGSLGGSATTASYVEYTNVVNKPTLLSSSLQIASDVSGSFTSVSSSLASRISLNEGNVSSLNSASSSYLLNTTDTLDGDLTVTGRITAQEFHTEFVSASIVYESGSTKFGDSADDVHQFTGSALVTGNVGIGTNSPLYDLVISNGGAEGIELGPGYLSGANLWQNYNRATSQYVKEIHFASEYQLLSGNVGIGTTSPQYSLEVYDTLRVDGLSGAGTSVSFGGSGDFSVDGPGVEAGRFVVKHGGSVGIGTGAPAYKFDISASQARILNSGEASWVFRDTNYGNITIGHGALSTGAGKFAIGGASADFVVNVDNSRVGIGTATPAQKLHVEGALRLTANPTVTGDGSSAQFWNQAGVGPTIAGNAFQVQINGTSPALHILNTGNVGIGTTSPSSKLDIRGTGTLLSTISSTSTDGASVFYAINDNSKSGEIGVWGSTRNAFGAISANNGYVFSNDDLAVGATLNVKFGTGANNTERMRIDANGNVGIGTTSIINVGTHVSTAGAAFSSTATKNSNMYGVTVTASTNESTMTGIWFATGGGSHWSGIAGARTSHTTSWGTHLSFYTHPDDFTNITDTYERLRIKSDGSIQHNFNPGGGSYYWQDTTNGATMFYLIPATYVGTAPYNANRIVAANSSRITLEAGNAERMTIVNDGEVIINGTQGSNTNPYPLRIEAGNGGVQAKFTRSGAYADIFMGGATSTGTQFFIRSGGVNGVRLDYAATSWISASDINLKNINHELTDILPKLQNIRAVNFSWKEDESNTENLGVIAQEVEAEFPQLVSVSEIDGMKGVKYTEFVPILLAAVKEQQAIIEDLKARIQTLENS